MNTAIRILLFMERLGVGNVPPITTNFMITQGDDRMVTQSGNDYMVTQGGEIPPIITLLMIDQNGNNMITQAGNNIITQE